MIVMNIFQISMFFQQLGAQMCYFFHNIVTFDIYKALFVDRASCWHCNINIPAVLKASLHLRIRHFTLQADVELAVSL